MENQKKNQKEHIKSKGHPSKRHKAAQQLATFLAQDLVYSYVHGSLNLNTAA